MATQVQWRGGSTAEHSTFTGAAREVTVDTQKQTLVLHDGSTAGGRALLREDGSNAALALGSAGTPSLKFAGDTNTGIYSPGADQLALSTNGTGRLFIDSSGFVGIGEANSLSELLVAGSNPSIYIKPNADTETSELVFRNAANAQSRGFVAYNHSDNSMAFRVNLSERLRITSAGFVGIGNSSPAFRLDVAAGSGDGIRYQNTVNSISTILGASNIVGQVGTTSSHPLQFLTGGTTRATLDTSGRLGIGTTSASSLLHVSAPAGPGAVNFRVEAPDNHIFRLARIAPAVNPGNLDFQVSSYGTGSIIADNTLTLQSGSGAPLVFNTSGATERFRCDSSGRLLVGTSTSVLETVAIKGDGGGLQVCRLNSGFATTGQALGSIGFKGTTSANSNAAAEVLIQAVAEENFSGTAAGSRLEFHTKANGLGPGSPPTERMRIRNNGEVLVGTTALPTDDNTTFGFGVSSGQELRVAVNNAKAAMFKRGSSDGTVIEFRRDGNAVGTISVTATATAYNTSSDYRLKENVIPVTDGITRLQQLKPSRFNFIADPAKTVDGFLAHEVQTVIPEAITGEKDAVDDDGNPVYQGIDQSKLVPLLTAALQEAIGEIESLKARVAALESA